MAKQAKQPSADIQHVKEIIFVVGLILALFLLVSLVSYSPADSAWSIQSSKETIHNAAGVPGAWFADGTLSLFGIMAYIMPLLLVLFSWQFYRDKTASVQAAGVLGLKLMGFVMLVVGVCGLSFLFLGNVLDLPQGMGGILGSYVGNLSIDYLHNIGATLLFWLLFFVGSTLFANVSWLKVADVLGAGALAVWAVIQTGFLKLKTNLQHRRAKKDRQERHSEIIKEREEFQQREEVEIAPQVTEVAPSKRQVQDAQVTLLDDPVIDPNIVEASGQSKETDNYIGSTTLPTLALLSPAETSGQGYSKETLQAMSRQVELKLKDFKVEVEVVAVQPGPVVTRFELMPAPGVKASKISSLASDLARSLAQVSVRVVEVIPGKSVIGLEVPNETREMVYLSEIIGSQAYEQAKSPLTFALGKDIAGHPVVADLAKMPHVLVAGTTGSGKSVCVNTMVVSLLYKSTPEDVRMIMVDPKMLELAVYEGIPHLLSPVVTDMNEAANALRWSVAEMERRYKLMSMLGVRNLSGFNKKVVDAAAKGEPLADPMQGELAPEEEPRYLEKLPYIVVLIDEFADMMMVVGKKVEELIVRLAQKARAAGIHLVLATQRPSVDVITGLIKSNVPTRMSFQVSSKMDSRVILDQGGAEQLLGKGDMLFLPPGQAFAERVHGAFVDDDEVHQVVEYLKERYETKYVEAVLHGYDENSDTDLIPGSKPAAGSGGGEQDALYDEAVQIVMETRKASISGVQRRLRIGYNRAARLIESMEEAGLVSAVGNNGQREVLVPPREE